MNDIVGLQRQIDTLQRKLDAICAYYGISIEYKPEEYTVQEAEPDEDDAGK